MYTQQANEAREFITQKINTSCIENYPFRHLVIDDFLPKSLYRQINRHFPDYSDVGFHDLMKPKYRFIKSVFDLETKNTKQEARDIYNIFSQIFDKALAVSIINKFDIKIDSEIAWMCDYCWDFPNNNQRALAPHTDHDTKIVSMVIYLPIVETPLRFNDGQIQYLPMPGTDLLIQNSDESFTKVREVEAKSNRMTMFCKNGMSWHSVEPTQYPRKTITMFIINPEGCKCTEGFSYKHL